MVEKFSNLRYQLVYTTTKGPNIFETNPKRLNRYVITKDDSESQIESYFDYEYLPIKKTETLRWRNSEKK